MSDASMPWFRLYSELPKDRKIKYAARMAGIPLMTMVGTFTTLLCIANDSPLRGALMATESVGLSIEDIADELEMPVDEYRSIDKALQHYDLIVWSDDGICYINKWDKRQFTSDNVNERVAKYRQRKKEPDSDRSSNADETPHDRSSNANETLQGRFGNGIVTPPESESESDLNLEEEGETAAKKIDDGWIFRLYETEVGPLTPMIADMLKDSEQDYERAWIEAAVKEAVTNQARNWKYVEAILKRWKKDGFGAPYPRGPGKNGGKQGNEPAGFAGIRAFLEKDDGE